MIVILHSHLGDQKRVDPHIDRFARVLTIIRGYVFVRFKCLNLIMHGYGDTDTSLSYMMEIDIYSSLWVWSYCGDSFFWGGLPKLSVGLCIAMSSKFLRTVDVKVRCAENGVLAEWILSSSVNWLARAAPGTLYPKECIPEEPYLVPIPRL